MKILYGSGNILVSAQTEHAHGSATQIAGFVSALERAGHLVTMDVSTGSKRYSAVRSKEWLRWIKNHFAPSWLMYELLQIRNNNRISARLSQLRLSHYDLLWQRYELFTTAYTEAASRASLPNVLFVDAPLIHERQEYGRLWLEGRAINVLRDNARLADLIVTISEPVKDYVQRYTDGDRADIYVMPNGFAEHILEVTEAEVSQVRQNCFGSFDGVVIGFAGYIKEWQSVDYLIQAAHRLSQDHDDFRVLIVGEGPELAEQQQLAVRLQLTETVRFTGNIPFREIGPYLQAFDIGVMPNSNVYGSPMKIPEYMACGAAVVAPDVGPIGTLYEHEKEGLLFPKDDVGALYDALRRLVEDRVLLRQMQRNAQLLAQETHSWTARIREIEPLLKEIIDDRGHRDG